MDKEKTIKENNEVKTAISEVITKLKDNQPKEGVNLLDITKKLTKRKLGKKI